VITKVSETIEIKASPDVVWAVIGDPEEISSWHPAIAASPITDGVRHCALEGGGAVEEPIIEHSDDGRYYVYTIAASPFDMTGYRSRLEVQALDGTARVVWSGEFEAGDPAQADGMAQAFSGIYKQGLESARQLAEAAP
jgi:hypothetical protein